MTARPDGTHALVAAKVVPRLVGMPAALEWCMTGRIFDAAEALDKGLVRSVHPQRELLDAVIAYLQGMGTVLRNTR